MDCESGELLQAHEEQFRQIAEAIHDLFFLVELPGLRVLYVSPA